MTSYEEGESLQAVGIILGLLGQLRTFGGAFCRPWLCRERW